MTQPPADEDGFVHAPDASPDSEEAVSPKRSRRALFGGMPRPWWAGKRDDQKSGHGGPAARGDGPHGRHHDSPAEVNRDAFYGGNVGL